MTPEQIQQAKALAGKMDRREIAKKLGVSLSNLKRSMRSTSFSFHTKWKNNPALVRQILEYYFQHGKTETDKRFPNMGVRSLVDFPERYGIERVYRQMRWTDRQKIELVRMAGLISHGAQAKFFGRPGAAGGSIKSAWIKIFNCAPGQLNGMPYDSAKHVATRDTEYIKPLADGRGMHSKTESHWIILWVDLEKKLRDDAADHVRSAVKTMADFQRWIWKSQNPKPKILKMIREREV